MQNQKYRNAIPVGEKIGSYRVEKILGQGGFGITYLAKDEKLDRYLAIKEYFPTEFSKREVNGSVIPQSGEDESVYEWGLERFLNEGKTLAKFKHPNIVRVIDYLEANNTAYIIMEYEHGDDLQNKLKGRKTLSCEEILNVFLPLLDGLAQVHKAGFIHRDIKPANIFIREDGSPVLIDFGSARQGLATKTKTLTTLVSPGYAPFEQYNADASSKQGPWTDIYALGASMYRCLFGSSPVDAVARAEERLSGREDSYMSAMYLGEEQYPLHILEAIDKALAFLPNDRPQSIDDWISILKEVKFPAASNEDYEETIKIEATVKQETPEISDGIKEPAAISRYDDAGLKLPITKYVVIGMLSLWSYTSYTLCNKLAIFASSIGSINISNKTKYIFSGIYILIMFLILSWIFPNVFMGYLLGKRYILKIVLISSVLFYVNTLAFVLWYVKNIKFIDLFLLDEEIKNRKLTEEKSRQTKNEMITKWEGIDNHVTLFLILSLPIIFSPYICARLFYSNVSQFIVMALPVIVMVLGGVFHVWGTRLLVNTYNNTLIK